jgi:uncharacterized protein YybS (DUF2232 family)
MSYPVDNAEDSTPDPWEEAEKELTNSEKAHSSSNSDSDQEEDWTENTKPLVNSNLPSKESRPTAPLAMVETAFLASTACLIWLINYYFPLGPVLRMFFPIPIALVYLRWGNRASWMAALVSGLLLSVLMGPPRSILFFIPYALMGVQLGSMWRRQVSWLWSIVTGALLGTIGFFFRFWLLSILLGEDLWVYVMIQITEILEWGFVKLGLLAQPSLLMIQVLAVLMIVFSNLVYVFVVHLVALLMLDKLGNPIPRPPYWVQVLLDYDG